MARRMATYAIGDSSSSVPKATLRLSFTGGRYWVNRPEEGRGLTMTKSHYSK
jgi:hypothetical protein